MSEMAVLPPARLHNIKNNSSCAQDNDTYNLYQMAMNSLWRWTCKENILLPTRHSSLFACSKAAQSISAKKLLQEHSKLCLLFS
jgi:hypothetical protein